MTIPRLELSGAVLLSNLTSRVLKILKLNSIPVFLWTDSAIVYTWINSHPSRWKEFIHNRVCHIHETPPHAIWRFTPGTENPADHATRGLSPAQLIDNANWQSGPSWLSLESSAWPQEPQAVSRKEHLEERMNQVLTTNVRSNQLWDLVYKYSNMTRLLRITSLCKRAVSRFRNSQQTSLTIPITTCELDSARLLWVKQIQQSYFSQELKILSKGNTLPSSHSLLRLTLFLDAESFLRVGDRLRLSLLPDNTKHPLILPKKSPLTTLIIADAHQRTLHGVEAVLNSRPLCPFTDDPDDVQALTPAHFLIESSLATIPEPSLETVKTSHLSRWQLTRQMLDSFWSHWSKECLQRYLVMYKWNKETPPLKEGSLVLVVDERYPPSKWPLGRVISSHPGKDGKIRVVTVRTQASTFKRPIVKLCPLPVPACI
ncbi:uncharacterized protein [Linepithema humile]|uniref:uncharacterized protein n=1 Tax=Linepithema humile TaxID=83485 RepID=UPI00351E3357